MFQRFRHNVVHTENLIDWTQTLRHFELAWYRAVQCRASV